jgi:mRNA interferase MazF
MAKFAVGTIISVLFPFSNLKGKKVRPALVLANVEFDNIILCQITSKPYSSKTAIRIEESDCTDGTLPVVSFVRPDKLFTADSSIIKKSLGKLRIKKRDKILQKVRKLFTVE